MTTSDDDTPKGETEHFAGDLAAVGGFDGPDYDDTQGARDNRPDMVEVTSADTVETTPTDSARSREADPLTVYKRLDREGRWKGEIEYVRNDMMKHARKLGMSKTESQQWVYAELDRMYPPEKPVTVSGFYSSQTSQPNTSDDGQIRGLSDLPEDWPELPDNASLSSEVGWVQAQRLRVVEEQPGGATVVHLDRAGTPTPSWAALGWLETSIRSYSKFVDVAARATASDDGEAAVMRRERVAIEEVEALLDEMRADES